MALFCAARSASVGAGAVLWPPTDAIEYASMATWMARGEGPVLRIGPAFLPARVPPTLSVLLLPQALLNGADAGEYHRSVFALAILAIAAVWRLAVALGLSARGALAAAAALALSPGFACYSGVVMSDVPGLLFVVLALLAARRALEAGPTARWSLVALAFSVGVLVTFRVTNLVWIAALAVFWRGRRARVPWIAAAAVACFLPLATLAAWQSRAIGSPFLTGYDFWHFRPRLDPRRAWSGSATENLEYYATELAGLRSKVEGTSLGWKSDLHTLPVAAAGLLGFWGLLRSRPRASPEGIVLRAALAASLAALAQVLYFTSPGFRSWRYIISWSLLSALGVGFALDRLETALAARGSRTGWLHPAAVAAIALAFLFPRTAAPGGRLVAWSQAVEFERTRSARDAATGSVRETRLPLALASLLAPRTTVFVPAPDALNDVHLAIIREFRLRPLRVDEGLESTWDELLRQPPAAAGSGRDASPPPGGP